MKFWKLQKSAIGNFRMEFLPRDLKSVMGKKRARRLERVDEMRSNRRDV